MWHSLGTGEFPAQMASNAENVSIWWHHHAPTELPQLVYWEGCSPMCLSFGMTMFVTLKMSHIKFDCDLQTSCILSFVHKPLKKTPLSPLWGWEVGVFFKGGGHLQPCRLHHWEFFHNPIFFEFRVMCCLLSSFHVSSQIVANIRVIPSLFLIALLDETWIENYHPRL